jgi:hemophore-related protein
MRTPTRTLVAGTGLAAALAVGVPVALADGGSTSPGTSSSPASCPAHPVKDYLAAHPDVAAELKTLHALPADQRKAARQAWAAQHQDLAVGLKQAATQARTQAGGHLGNRLGAAGDYLAAHPDVAALLDQLKNAPAGSRAQAARQYLTAHPGVRTELHDLRATVRQHRAACGGSTK